MTHYRMISTQSGWWIALGPEHDFPVVDAIEIKTLEQFATYEVDVVTGDLCGTLTSEGESAILQEEEL